MRDPGALEHATAAGLDPVASEAVIDAVDRNVELDGQVTLELSHVERHDEGTRTIRHQRTETGQQLRSLEDLLRERARRVVVRAEEVDASARVLRLGDETQVVVNDLVSHWKAGHD